MMPCASGHSRAAPRARAAEAAAPRDVRSTWISAKELVGAIARKSHSDMLARESLIIASLMINRTVGERLIHPFGDLRHEREHRAGTERAHVMIGANGPSRRNQMTTTHRNDGSSERDRKRLDRVPADSRRRFRNDCRVDTADRKTPSGTSLIR